MFGRKAHLRIRMLNLDFRDQMSEFLLKTLPGPAVSLTPPPKLLQLGRHTLADRLPVHHEVSRLMILPTDVSETQKVKGFRLPVPTLGPPFSGITPEFNQTRLLRV